LNNRGIDIGVDLIQALLELPLALCRNGGTL
jgi:hypothetical protein